MVFVKLIKTISYSAMFFKSMFASLQIFKVISTKVLILRRSWLTMRDFWTNNLELDLYPRQNHIGGIFHVLKTILKGNRTIGFVRPYFALNQFYKNISILSNMVRICSPKNVLFGKFVFIDFIWPLSDHNFIKIWSTMVQN